MQRLLRKGVFIHTVALGSVALVGSGIVYTLDNKDSGNTYFSRVCSRLATYGKEDKTLSKEASQSPKPCCGCLGLNTMANVATRVAPAVVTIAVLKVCVLNLSSIAFMSFEIASTPRDSRVVDLLEASFKDKLMDEY